MSPSVTFQSKGQPTVVSLEGRHSLLTFARLAGLPVPAICGGHGTCGKCALQLLNGAQPPPDPIEEHVLARERIAEGWRLSCRLIVEGDTAVAMPAHQQVAAPGKGGGGLVGDRGKPEPPVASVPLPCRAGNSTAALDEDTFLGSLGQPARSAALPALRDAANLRLRQGGEEGGATTAWAVARGRSVIDILVRRSRPRLLGVAVDVGTTTLAAYLVDLETCEELAAASAPNAQAGLGADIMSRADQALHGHAAELQDAVVAGINGLITELCAIAGVTPAEIYEATVAGNSCMHHLLLGLPVDRLAKAPYRPVLREHLDLPAAELNLNINPAGMIYAFPLIGGFVGGDVVADLLCAQLLESNRPRLLIDLGTNAEVVLCSNGEMVACSTPAGPAFEGGRIRCGTQAIDGAITGVDVLDGEVHVTTLGGSPAIGIAGSGLIDAVAALRRERIIDARGLYQDHPAVVSGPHGKQVVLSDASVSANGTAIVLAQEDIIEFQLARAAIRAGVEILCGELAFGANEVAEVLVAGAFGSAMRVESMRSIGLLPPMPAAEVVCAGNATGNGAKLALVCLAQRRQADRVASAVRYVELAGHPRFTDAFARHLLFE